MATYYLTVPFAGSYITVIEADSEKEAMEKAEAAEEIERLTMVSDVAEIQEWASYRRLVDGNILHVPCNEMTVDNVEEDA